MLDDVTSAEDLKQRIMSGVFEEGHHLEAKQEVPTRAGSNLELAKDLASLAVSGGTLVIGVAEDKPTRTFSLHPVALAGLAERIEQVATDRIHPRLTLRIRTIPDPNDPTAGFLLVDVPASPEAPHMVDGRYYGRGDMVKTVLDDGQVRMLLDRRARQLETFDAILDRAVANDPTREDLRSQAHLFIVAMPAHCEADMLHNALQAAGTTMGPWAYAAVRGGAPAAALTWPSTSGFAPDLSNASHPSTRANGIGLSSWPHAPDVSSLAGERDLLDVEIDDDGMIRLFTSAATVARSINDAPERRLVMDGFVPTLVIRTIRMAVVVSDAAGYTGSWHVGVHINNLRGAMSDSRYQNPGMKQVAYSADEFRRSELFALEDLRRHERDVTLRLCGRFLRGLGVDPTG